jgi:hypothetical protein
MIYRSELLIDKSVMKIRMMGNTKNGPFFEACVYN